MTKPGNEQRYYDALKLIATCRSPEWLRKNAEKEYGVPYEEALEMAYENLSSVAQQATRGRRRP